MSQEDSTIKAATGENTPAVTGTTPQAADTGDTPEVAATEPDQPEQQEHSKNKQSKNKGTNARKTRSVTLTLTVTGTADGEWQAELKHGSTWVAKGLTVPAAAVSRAAKELHEELSVSIDEVIDAAREQQQARVAQLEAELEQARQALANLDEG